MREGDSFQLHRAAGWHPCQRCSSLGTQEGAGVGTRLQGLPREPGVQGAVGPTRSKGEASEVFAPQMQNLRGNEKTQ